MCLYFILQFSTGFVFVFLRNTEPTICTIRSKLAFAFPRGDDKLTNDRFEVITQHLWKKRGDVPVHFKRRFVSFDGSWVELRIRRDIFRIHWRIFDPVV